MNNLDIQYINLLKDIKTNGTLKDDRTGTGTISVTGRMIQHDMSEGFPALTTKKLYFKTMSIELEGFLKGITDKQWFQDRKCRIWNQWSSKLQMPENLSEEEQGMWLIENNDLGPLGYSHQWRNFGGRYKPIPFIWTGFDRSINVKSCDNKHVGRVIDGKYGKYTVVSYDGDNTSGNPKFTVKFHKTGYVKSNVDIGQINSGTVKDYYFPKIAGVACVGNYNKNILGEDITNKLMNTWNDMIQRCYNENNSSYINYGAKGVYVSNSWLIFENYLKDVQDIDNWEKKLTNWDEYQLDKDLNGGYIYSKEVCVWLTRKENNNLTNQNYYFDAISPDGVLYENQIGLSEFCSKHSLNEKNVQPSMKNDTKTCGGWKFYRKDQYKKEKKGVDQIEYLLNLLENDPDSRRMLVTAWNPQEIDSMALPPCHHSFQVIKRGEYLDLIYIMRSNDLFLGAPFNISSYGLLLELLCKQFGYKPGILTGFLGDTHIYKNHLEQVDLQISRLEESYDLPTLNISDSFKDIRDFDHDMIKLEGYQSHPPIKGGIAV